MLVPLNALLAMICPERGARHRAGCALARAAAGRGAARLLDRLRVLHGGVDLLEHWALRSPPTPLVGRLAFAAAFAAALCWRAWPDFTPLQVGNAAALVALLHRRARGRGSRTSTPLSWPPPALILIVALLQESHQLAFRDALTGLPGRRALEERLRALGGHYAIAMVDVDHFKKFNDTHGHDIGDQVLKLVGGRLPQAATAASPTATAARSSAVLFPARRADRGAAASSRRCARSDRELPHGGARRGPSEEDEGGREASQRHEDESTTKVLSVTISSASPPLRKPAPRRSKSLKAPTKRSPR